MTMTTDVQEFTSAAPSMRRASAYGARGPIAEALAQWWGPKGTTMRVLKLEFRPGGMFHYTIAFQPGHEMYARFIYREIVAPERIAFVISFSDAAGGITRAPFPQLKNLWPLEVLNVVTFTEQGGKTTVALRGRPINATDEERAMFAANTNSMRGASAALSTSSSTPGEILNHEEPVMNTPVMAPTERALTITRVFDAPARARVEGVDRAGARATLVGAASSSLDACRDRRARRRQMAHTSDRCRGPGASCGTAACSARW